MTAAEQLADARHDLGLSLADISSRTKISVERLSAVERGDPGALPSLVYLKGFVRAYAAEVKLDPELIWRRYFCELPNPVEPLSAEKFLVIAPGDEDALAEFDSENDQAEPMSPQPTAAEVAVVPPFGRPEEAGEVQLLGAAETAVAASMSAPFGRATQGKSFALVFVLATMVAFVSAYLVKANMDRYAPPSGTVPASGRSTEPTTAASQTPATYQQPSLSTPMDVGGGRQPAPPAPATEVPPLQTEGRSYIPDAPTDSIRNSTGNAAGRPGAGRQIDSAIGRGAAVDRSLPATAPPTASNLDAMSTDGTAGHANTVSGVWNLTSTVESATVAEYQNLMLGFRLDLEQRGNKVVGEGRKVSENGVALLAQRRTPIRVEGTLEGNRLALDFTEVGARRNSAGHFLLYLAEDGSFRGRFRSEAAKSTGVTVAVRQSLSGRD